jgi:hypothetical protein
MSAQPDVQTAEPVEQQAPESNVDQTQLQAASNQETDAQRNWKQMRETLAENQRQLKLAQERERQYQDALSRAHLQKPAEEPEDHLNPDDIVTVAQAKKVAAREVQRLIKQHEDSRGEDEARREFSDYDSVVTKENLERLAREKPKLWQAISENQSLYGKATTAYGFLKTMVGTPEDQESAARIKKNMAKPQSAMSVAPDKPLHHAHNFERGLTPELRSSLLREMNEAIKSR